MAWAPEARQRLGRVPSFVRGVVTARVEAWARERGYAEITPAVMDEVRRSLPVDFSKRLPFFMRREAGAGSPNPTASANPNAECESASDLGGSDSAPQAAQTENTDAGRT